MKWPRRSTSQYHSPDPKGSVKIALCYSVLRLFQVLETCKLNISFSIPILLTPSEITFYAYQINLQTSRTPYSLESQNRIKIKQQQSTQPNTKRRAQNEA